MSAPVDGASIDSFRRPGSVPGAQAEGDPLPLDVLYKISTGEALSREDQARWDSYKEHEQRREQERSRIGLVDLAEVMRDGVEPLDMLVDEWLVRGEHHVFFGEAGGGKTWLVLLNVAVLLRAGKVVLWVDLEMGRRSIAERLLLLGVTSDEAENLVYLEYPSFDLAAGGDSQHVWKALLLQRPPDLVVFDAQTGALAAADVDENSGTGVGKWQRAYIEPARAIGASVIVIDHTPLGQDGRPVASRQKGAAAKLMYAVKTTKKFDRHSVGAVKVTVTKNGLAAEIPETRSFRIGAGEEGRFVFEQALVPSSGSGREGESVTSFEIRRQVEQRIREAGAVGLTTSQLRGLVTGADTAIIKAAKSLADDEGSSVRSDPGTRASVVFSWVEAPSADA